MCFKRILRIMEDQVYQRVVRAGNREAILVAVLYNLQVFNTLITERENHIKIIIMNIGKSRNKSGRPI